MINLENRPTTRLHVYGDGRTKIVPTSRGLSYTEKEKELRKTIHINSEKAKGMHERQSIVWNQIRPLYERGVLNLEIEMITGLSHRQVVRAIGQNKYRPEWNKGKTDVDRRKEAWRLRKEAKLPTSEDKGKSIELTRIFFKEGLITKDISTWWELNEIYKLNQRSLPEDVLDQIRLEIFLVAIKYAEAELDSAKLNSYKELADRVGGTLLMNKLSIEEQFIKSKICNVWKWDGEDRTGLYVQGKNGRKIYEMGDLGYLTSAEIRTKRSFRENPIGVRKKTANDRYAWLSLLDDTDALTSSRKQQQPI